MELTGCGPREAAEALAEHKEIWLAVDALLPKPTVAGEKYIPSKPTIDSGMTLEQQARCERGRWLQDRVNAVFSVAHSKIQSPPDPGARAEPLQLTEVPMTDWKSPQTELVSPQDVDEKAFYNLRNSRPFLEQIHCLNVFPRRSRFRRVRLRVIQRPNCPCPL
jgi:hypothetical protein